MKLSPENRKKIVLMYLVKLSIHSPDDQVKVAYMVANQDTFSERDYSLIVKVTGLALPPFIVEQLEMMFHPNGDIEVKTKEDRNLRLPLATWKVIAKEIQNRKCRCAACQADGGKQNGQDESSAVH